MPNTVPPIVTADDAQRYADAIAGAGAGQPPMRPLLTVRAGADVCPETVTDLAHTGVVAAKLYPRGATTNSADGVDDLSALYPLLEALQDAELVLCIHAEDPAAPVLEREAAYLPTVGRLAADFPRLRIVVEHLSTREAVDALATFPETVAATVTVHHLLYTLDDLLGERLAPHLFCKPVVKQRADREALRLAVSSGNPRIFFGSDSAPHRLPEKAAGAAGVFSAPVAMELLAALFQELELPLTPTAGHPTSLEQFCSRFGAEFYRLPLNAGRLEISDEPYRAPDRMADYVPLAAGTTLGHHCRRPSLAFSG